MNQTSRRNFVFSTGLASGAVLMGGVQTLLSSADRGNIGKVVSRYGTNLGSTTKTDGTVQLKVRVKDYDQLAKALSDPKMAWDQVEALEGNILKFTGGAETVIVKHVA